MEKLTGPLHELDKQVHKEQKTLEVLIEQVRPVAEAVLADFRENVVDGQAVYEVVRAGVVHPWRRVGLLEEHAASAAQEDCLVVADGDDPTPVFRHLLFGAYNFLGGLRGRQEAVRELEPVAAMALALQLGHGMEWASEETLVQAAGRLLKDAAVLPRNFSPNVTRRLWEEYTWLLEGDPHQPRFGYVQSRRLGSWREVAQAYLNSRSEITRAIDEQHVNVGQSALAGPEAARRAGVAWSTWRAYVSADRAPAADLTGPARWWPLTVDAWRIATGRSGPAG
ncbi:hypothetical protein [Actinocorallia populi]|uniref:hypothetical protein n=1 Tax=Actinocorallia populi TaxID=2079200 RepID=UPI000D08A7A3|nr:hypothetical protein [Actinocorallia populi]